MFIVAQIRVGPTTALNDLMHTLQVKTDNMIITWTIILYSVANYAFILNECAEELHVTECFVTSFLLGFELGCCPGKLKGGCPAARAAVLICLRRPSMQAIDRPSSFLFTQSSRAEEAELVSIRQRSPKPIEIYGGISKTNGWPFLPPWSPI